MIRVVVDTNVLIDAQWRKSFTARLFFQHIGNGDAVLLYNDEIMLEYAHETVGIAYDHGATKLEMQTAVVWVVRMLQQHGEHVDSSAVECLDCPDPADRTFVECAIAGGATCIVSNDNDLTFPDCPVPVYTPQEMQKRFVEFRGVGIAYSGPPRRKRK